MSYSLGEFCSEDDKYLDPESYYDPYFCCDQFFTNTGAYEAHKMVHAAYVKARGNKSSKDWAPFAEFYDVEEVDELDMYGSSSDDEELGTVDDVRMANLVGTDDEECESPWMKPKKRCSNNSNVDKDHPPYSCDKCKEDFAGKGLYWHHMIKIHKECVACEQVFKTDLHIDDHCRSSPICLDWPEGFFADVVHIEYDDVDYKYDDDDDDDDDETDEDVPEPASQKACAEDSTGKELSSCSLCDEISPSDSALNRHISRIHNKCLRCKVQFQSIAELMEHCSKSQVHRFCPICSWDFLTHGALEMHNMAIHPLTSMTSGKRNYVPVGAGPNVCEFCPKDIISYSTVEKLESHLQRQHIRCFPCKREFTAQTALCSHLQMHPRHNYCQLCDTDFVSAEALKQHAFICGLKSLLSSSAQTAPASRQVEKRDVPEIGAPKAEESSKSVTEIGKLKLNDDTGPAKEVAHSNASKWEIADGDEDDVQKTNSLPRSKDDPVFVSKDSHGGPQKKAFSGIAVKEAPVPVLVSKDAHVDPQKKVLSGIPVKEAPVPVLVSKDAHVDPQKKALSGIPMKEAPVPVLNVAPCDPQQRTAAKQAPVSVSGETPVPQLVGDRASTSAKDDDRFTCLACGGYLGSGTALNQHYAIAHTKCQRCKIKFESQRDLHNHHMDSKVHVQKYCGICKMVFSSREGFRAHGAAVHSAQAKDNSGVLHSCDVCIKSFPTEETVEVHLRREHVRCFPCKREFGKKQSLFNHLADSSQHNYCARCETDFVSKKAFNRHGCPGFDGAAAEGSHTYYYGNRHKGGRREPLSKEDAIIWESILAGTFDFDSGYPMNYDDDEYMDSDKYDIITRKPLLTPSETTK